MNIYDQMHSNMPKEELTASFVAACHVGDLDAVISLLTNPEFEKHIDVHYNNDVAFQWAIYHKRIEVVHYLIMEYKIEKTETISEFLSNHKIDGLIRDATKLFDLREINDSLEKELPQNANNKKKSKL
jgi:hypothetical protein